MARKTIANLENELQEQKDTAQRWFNEKYEMDKRVEKVLERIFGKPDSYGLDRLKNPESKKLEDIVGYVQELESDRNTRANDRQDRLRIVEQENAKLWHLVRSLSGDKTLLDNYKPNSALPTMTHNAGQMTAEYRPLPNDPFNPPFNF